jgi:preprotein translocase subunit SecA
MAARVKAAVVERLFKVQLVHDTPMELPTITAWTNTQESRGSLSGEAARGGAPAPPRPAPRTASGEKVGRNDPCPCGSGKKYKRCCYLKQNG